MNEYVIHALETMDLRDSDAWVRDYPEAAAQLLHQACNFPSFVLPDIDHPSVVCGIGHSLGVGEVWMLASSAFETNWRAVLPMQRELCASMYRTLSLHRMHMLVDAAAEKDKRYAAALGFEFDVPARRFGVRGKDMEFWVWPEKGERA